MDLEILRILDGSPSMTGAVRESVRMVLPQTVLTKGTPNAPIRSESIIGLPDYKIISCNGLKTVEIVAEFTGLVFCNHCRSTNLRKKERFQRVLKHHSIGSAKSVLILQTHKFHFRDCGKYFNQRVPGILPYQRVTEPFKDEVATRHHDGHSILKVSQRLALGQATVGRYYKSYLQREFNEHKNASCPKILGIDEKKFSKKMGYQTTLVNLQKHTVFDVTLGRTESNLGKYLRRLIWPRKSGHEIMRRLIV